MKPETFSYVRLVKSEDLNHHGTLFAGRCAEWFVEAAFITAASALPAENIVCLKVHGFEFSKPIQLGEIAHFESRIVYIGRTSLIVNTNLKNKDNKEAIVSGFITFVNVNKNGRPFPHGLALEFEDREDFEMNKVAASLRQ
jgi:acyl-CoA hydrolase